MTPPPPARPRIYLDNNATTRPFTEVVETVAEQLRASFANPGSRHAHGRIARQVLENARESLAANLGALPEEIIFTSGGTESINLALGGLTAHQSPGTMLLTAGEHPATMEFCKRLVARGWKMHLLDVDSSGCLIADQYAHLPWHEVKLATVIWGHNETGVVQDLAPLAEACAAHNVPLHVDGVQMVGKLPVDFHALPLAALSLGAHKFHGPRGIGALVLRKGISLVPALVGGHQESGRRPGTEPVAIIAGMARALEIFAADAPKRIETIRALRDRLEKGLRNNCGPVVVHGAQAQRLPNTLNIAFPGLDGEALLVALDLAGISCSLGSTCASGSAEPAPVLLAMRTPAEVARASVRFSVSIDNTAEEIDDAVCRITDVVRRLRARSSEPGA